MKNRTAFLTPFVLLTSVSALADCDLTVSRYQQQQQQQAQYHPQGCPSNPVLVPEDTQRYANLTLDQCLDAYFQLISHLESSSERSFNRVLSVSYLHRGVHLTNSHSLQYRQQQQEPQQRQQNPQTQQQHGYNPMFQQSEQMKQQFKQAEKQEQQRKQQMQQQPQWNNDQQ